MLEFINEALLEFAEVHNLDLRDGQLLVEIDRAALGAGGSGLARFSITVREVGYDD